MKKLLTLALAIVPLLAMSQDDLYFMPSKKAKHPSTVVRPAYAAPTPYQAPVNYGSCSRSDDEYNRRYSYSGDSQNAGGMYANDSTLGNDTVWSKYDMNDPEVDYRYSRRLVRFHSPRYYSPYYWDLMYAYGAWDYLYDPYDPWYWHYGWGFGWSWGPWDCWYGGIWGYSRPYHWAYWGWGPGWHSHWGPGHVVVGHNYYRPRGQFNLAARRTAGIRTSPVASAGRGTVRTSRGTAAPRRSTISSPRSDSRAIMPSRSASARYDGVRSGTTSRGDMFGRRESTSRRTEGTVRGSENTVRRTESSRTNTVERNAGSRTITPSRSATTPSRSGFGSSSPSRSVGSMGGGASRGGSMGGGGSRGGGRR